MVQRLIVGIDVGMTCTGVAYAIQGDGMVMNDPHVIQKWPGNTSGESNKVPTVICYNNKQLSSWGFLCGNEDLSDPKIEDHDWFKVMLDPTEYQRMKTAYREKGREQELPQSHEEVRRYYRDFMSKLYGFLRRALEDNLGRQSWEEADIEFIFSVPTTWTALGVTKDFETLANEAGFGRDGAKHILTVGLTEAEAAAVYTFKAQSASYADNDILLVVDAGGGTTDLALLRTSVKENQLPKLDQLDEVKGDGIGSVAIDEAFISLVIERLTPYASQLNLTKRSIARRADEMAQKSFKHHKEGFGNEDNDRQTKKMIPIPGIPDNVTIDGAGIRRGKLEITNTDLEKLFKTQLNELENIVNCQMNKMSIKAPNEQITHMVLSGGLGSSPYIKKELIRRFVTESRNPYARNLRIITSSLPQLAVVKGIILDRLQKLERNSKILTTRICRMSLGVVCNQVYNPTIHKNQELTTDPIDGKTYARGQIRWFIKQGEPLTEDTVEYKFYRTLRKHGVREAWTDQIAMCNNRTGKLPKNIREDGYNPLCSMSSNLTSLPLDRFDYQKKHWWHGSKKPPSHYTATYTVKFVMRPASVDFELWFQGRKYNDPSSFEVEWKEGARISAPRDHRLEEIPDHSRFA